MTEPSDLGSAPVPPPREGDHARGAAGAPLVVVYGDFTCPRCAVAWDRLAGAPLRLVLRHFALRAKHPRAPALAQAAEAAGAQGAFWPFAEALWADQGRQDDPHLWAHAERLGLDVDRFEADRRGPRAAERVTRDVREALRAGVTATPTCVAFDAGRVVEVHPGPPASERVRQWARFGSTEL